MFCQNQGLRIGLAIALGFTIAGLPLLAVAQQYRPPRRGIPTRRDGAGTRSANDRCITGQTSIMAITPMDNFSLTTAQKPVFFWFVPGTNAPNAEFRLLDRADREIYTTSVKMAGGGGIVSLQLPQAIANQMSPGTDYVWQFSLKCSNTDPSKNPFLEGIVQRTEMTTNLKSAVETATTPREIATLYAEAGIWHEAIATLAAQRCRQPNDSTLKTSWATLFQSVELARFSTAPLTRSCESLGAESGGAGVKTRE